MRRLFTILLMAIALVVVTAPVVSGSNGFAIPIDTFVASPPGSLTVLAEVSTPADHVADTCVGIAVAANGTSVHPNNNLIIESGGTSVVLADVEEFPNKVTTALGDITLGTTIKVTLQMGTDGIFSGGIIVGFDDKCTPPPLPEIGIVKTADPTTYVNNTGEFTIAVTNIGPVDLNSVFVEDDYALNIDPTSKCATTIGDLAVGDTFTYECTIAGLDGVSTYDNTATAIGTGPRGVQVTATDNAIIVPEVLATTLTTQAPPTTQAPATTQAPGTTSAPGETLPVTGIDGAQAEGFGVAGLVLVLVGIVLLGGAALIGQRKSIG